MFLLPPETAHRVVLKALTLFKSLYNRRYVLDKPIRVMGLDFPNRVGLAAGLDVNGEHIEALSRLGFGFIEVGGVTPNAQPGNPSPWLFRIPEKSSLINRKNFKNKGIKNIVHNLQELKRSCIIGVNISKNEKTTPEHAIEDYVTCYRAVYEHVDYVVVNLSCPNTPSLRALELGEGLHATLSRLKAEQNELAKKLGKYTCLAFKVSPDLSDEDLIHTADALLTHKIDAVIATNTTSRRPEVEGLRYANEKGGLSGSPLLLYSLPMIKKLHAHLGDRIPIIGLGGIQSADDAQMMLDAGASLVQIYTGLIYQGPGLIKDIATN